MTEPWRRGAAPIDAPTGAFADLPAREVFPGVVLRTFDSDKATVNQYSFEPGASFPIHCHTAEQITLIEEGDVVLTVADDSVQLRMGDWSVLPGDRDHGITAGSAGARIVAIVVPRRTRPDEYTVVEC